MYVEDACEDRDLILRAVFKSEAGFRVRLQDNYNETIDYLSHRGLFQDPEQFPLPDLVLLDYSLKRFKGLDLLIWIRTQSKMPALPVVMLSANTEEHIVAKCYARGANYFVEKPAQPRGLLEFVHALDACLGVSPVQLKPLEKFAIRPELARRELSEQLRESLAIRVTLKKEQAELTQHLDLLTAERKELKRIPVHSG